MAEVAEDLTASGPALTLRYPRAQDAPRLFELASDPLVTDPFSWGPYEKQGEAAEWIASLPRNRADGIALEFAITDPADRPIGVISLLEISRRVPPVNIVLIPICTPFLDVAGHLKNAIR